MTTPKNQTSTNAGTVPTPEGNPNLVGAKADPKTAAKGNGKPGRKPGQPAKAWDFTGLDAAFVSSPSAVTPELASLTAPMRARNEMQVAMDGVVASLHREYVAAGKPERWGDPKTPKRAYHVNPQVADTLRMVVRRAATFLGLSVKFGKPARDTQGREIVVFTVRDQRVRASKGKDTWTLAELREYVTYFYADDAEGAEAFLEGLAAGAEDEAEDEEEEEENSES